MTGESVVLSLIGDEYLIRRGQATGSGLIAVEGDEITFWSSNLCEGTGRYRWTIADERLSFEAIEPDACPGRSEVLIGVKYGGHSPP